MPFNYKTSLDGVVDLNPTNYHGSFGDVDNTQDEPDIDRIGTFGDNDDPFDYSPFDDDDDYPGEPDIIDEFDEDEDNLTTSETTQTINEVDIDPDPTLDEPDWSPTDVEWIDMGVSDEDDPDQDTDDNDAAETDDEQEESPEQEIRQEHEIEQDDSTAQLEEMDIEEPIVFQDDDEFDLEPGDELEEEIFFDLSDPSDELTIETIINSPSEVIDLSQDEANYEAPYDFTDLDFSEAEAAVLFQDFYDPSESGLDFGNDLIDLNNPLDDVFVNVIGGDDLGVPFFQMMDDLDILDDTF